MDLLCVCTDHIMQVEDAVRRADIIVTATNASAPLFNGEWLSAGAHINAVGSYTPDARELDGATLQRAHGS